MTKMQGAYRTWGGGGVGGWEGTHVMHVHSRTAIYPSYPYNAGGGVRGGGLGVEAVHVTPDMS